MLEYYILIHLQICSVKSNHRYLSNVSKNYTENVTGKF